MSVQNAKATKFNKKTVKDIDVSHKRVLVRVDYNVPVDTDTRQFAHHKILAGPSGQSYPVLSFWPSQG